MGSRPIRSASRPLFPRSAVAVLVLLLLALACEPSDGPEAEGTPQAAEPTTEETGAPPADEQPTEDTESDAAADGAFSDGGQITVIVPFGAGGGFDLMARLLQPVLEEKLEELTGASLTVIVENVTGGGSRVGVETGVRAEPDGTTIFMASLDVMMGHQVVDDAPFDVTEMVPIGQLAADTRSLMIRPGVLPEGEQSFQALVERSQELPILWGSAGLDIPTRLIVSLLREHGHDLVIEQVEVEGTPEGVASMLRDELEVYMVTTVTAVQETEANPSLDILVVFADERDPAAPDVPTLADEGIAGAEQISLVAGYTRRLFMGPPGLDEAAADALQEAFRQATEDPEFLEQAEQAGYVINYAPPEQIQQWAEDALALYQANADVLREQ